VHWCALRCCTYGNSNVDQIWPLPSWRMVIHMRFLYALTMLPQGTRFLRAHRTKRSKKWPRHTSQIHMSLSTARRPCEMIMRWPTKTCVAIHAWTRLHNLRVVISSASWPQIKVRLRLACWWQHDCCTLVGSSIRRREAHMH